MLRASLAAILTCVKTELDRELEKTQAALLARFAADTRVRRIRWSQGETQYFELGTGSPLLYVHGGLGGAYEVVPILAALAKNHRVLAVDRPGHGLADPFDYRGVDLLAHARTFLGDILDALELATVDVVANSMGGLWSVAFAIDAPSRVSRLVLVGAPVGLRSRPPLLMLPIGLPAHRPTARQTHVLERDARREPEVLGAGPRRAPRETRRPAARRRRRAHATERREHARPGAVHCRCPAARVSTRADPGRPLGRVDDADASRPWRTRRLRIAGGGRRARREKSEPSPRSACRGRTQSVDRRA